MFLKRNIMLLAFCYNYKIFKINLFNQHILQMKFISFIKSKFIFIISLYITWNDISYILFFSDEDSDADLVTDYLSGILKDDETQEIISNNRPKVLVQPLAVAGAVSTSTGEHINNTSNNINTNNNHHHHQNNIHIATMHHNNMNMVPIISVTPHSPGSKHNNILGTFHVFVFLYVFMI